MLLLLAAALASCGMAVSGNTGKSLSSAGLLFDVVGIVQLELSGLFDDTFKQYSGEENFPGGPPSNITRQIIDNPDTPIRTWVRNSLFFERRTGFYLIVLGFYFQLAGVWLWTCLAG